MLMQNKIIDNKFREILIPTMLIAMALNISIIVDSSFVAHYIGHNGQAALQVLEPLVLLVTIFEWLFGLGGQILSLNKKAEFDEEGSDHYFTVAVLTTIVLSIIILAICFIFKDSIILMLHPTPEVVPFVSSYATFVFISFPLATILAVLTQFIRVDGQPNLASALIIIANAINIVLDYVFLGYLHMGIEGASLATTIGYAVGLLCVLKYHFDSKRTFKFILSELRIKSWIKSSVEIIKIGFPGASIGLFDVVLVYSMNIILSSILGTIGLDIYNASVNALLVISIIIIGFSETLSSIVQIYYTQNDFNNLQYIVRKSIMLTLICSVAFTIFLWVYPDGFLIFFNLNQMPNDAAVEMAIRLYSLSFIPYVIVSILIFYYEGIERIVPSGIVSFISGLAGPLLFTFILYPLIGGNGIWLSFFFGMMLAILAAVLCSKIIQRREKEYYGLFYIKRDMIPKSRNYAFANFDDKSKDEMDNHLKCLDVDDSDCKKLDDVLKYIFESNGGTILLNILIIDYDDCIIINIKDEGKREIIRDNAEFSDDEQIDSSEVLGFNNVKLTLFKD